MQRYPLLFLLFAIIFFSCPVLADEKENYYNVDAEKQEESVTPSGTQTVLVTSVQKCYAQLKHEDVLDIRKNYTKPYYECQRRLALKIKEKQQAKAGEVKDSPPEAPSNFYRVQGSSSKQKKAADSKTEKAPVE
jgi:hypothetical protein